MFPKRKDGLETSVVTDLVSIDDAKKYDFWHGQRCMHFLSELCLNDIVKVSDVAYPFSKKLSGSE